MMSDAQREHRFSSLSQRPCWGCGASPAPGVEFMACGQCQWQKLVACTLCSLECMTEHWPRHVAWHKKTRKEAKRLLAMTPKAEWVPDDPSWPAEVKTYNGLLREAAGFQDPTLATSTRPL